MKYVPSTLLLILNGLYCGNVSAQCCEMPMYPCGDRPIRVVVPFAPGSGADFVARVLQPEIKNNLVIDNRPGAGGAVAAEIIARTSNLCDMLITSSSFTVLPALHRNLKFDPLRDFSPITVLADAPLVLVASPSVAVRSIKELIAFAKANPGKLTGGSPGAGTINHLALEQFKLITNTNILHIPYKGQGPLTVDLVGNAVQLGFLGVGPASAQAKSGKLKPLAISASERIPNWAELPTIAESGVPGYDVRLWYGVLASPKNTSTAINGMHSAFSRAAQQLNVKQKFEAESLRNVNSSPQQFAETIKNDVARWARVVKEAQIKID